MHYCSKSCVYFLPDYLLIYFAPNLEFAYRRCSADGAWTGRHPNDSSPNGWTNYTPCFPPLVQSLFDQVYDDEGDAQVKFRIAEFTRYMEIFGYSISYFAIIASLIIFKMFKSLHNRRTLIHRNLFTSILVEITIRQFLYIAQLFGPSSRQGGKSTLYSINSIPYLCEAAYVFLEYANSVMFMWMFIEGVFLNNVVTDRALRFRSSYKTYLLIGWLLPMVGTVAWALTTGYFYFDERVNVCWYGYNFHWFYWIAQGPRWIIIAVNLVFLLNIMQVLVLKLHRNTNSERRKLMRAVRAALILLPLLGITNALSMFEPPLDSSVLVFGTWCYVTHFLRSFQGLFISVLYCFWNGEVQTAIRKRYANHRIMREYRRRPRNYRNSVAAIDRRNEMEIQEELPMQELGTARGSTTNGRTNNAVLSEALEGCTNGRTNNAVLSEALERCTIECQALGLCCHRSPTPPRRTPVQVTFANPPLTGLRLINNDFYIPPRSAWPARPRQARYPVTPLASRVQYAPGARAMRM